MLWHDYLLCSKMLQGPGDSQLDYRATDAADCAHRHQPNLCWRALRNGCTGGVESGALFPDDCYHLHGQINLPEIPFVEKREK